MANKPITCTCGAEFNSDGVCPSCGKKRPRSAGYRVFHGTLCCIAALILLLCMSTTAFVRHQLKYQRLTRALQSELKLSGVNVPGEGKTIAEYIRTEYVNDDAVLTEDCAEAVDCMEIPAFIAGKLTVWGDLLRGDSDTVMQVSADEIIDLLEKHEAQLYRSCMLVIDDSDKQELRSSLEGPLDSVNKSFQRLYGSPALRALARFRVSGWHYVLDLILLALLLWRWAVIRRNSGKEAISAFSAMGKTVLIPSAITFVLCAVFGIGAMFAKDGVVGLLPVWKAIRMPYWMSAMLGISAGCVLLIIYQLMLQRSLRPAKERPVKAAPKRGGAAAAAAGEKHCIYCGKRIPAEAEFCIYCGKRLTPASPEAAAAVPDVPADIPSEPVADILSDTDQPES